MAERKTVYVSANLTVPARDALQLLTLTESARARKRLPMSRILLAALAVAQQHPEELAARVDDPATDYPSDDPNPGGDQE